MLTALKSGPRPHAFTGGRVFFGDVTGEVGCVVGVPMDGAGVDFPLRCDDLEDPLLFCRA